MMNNFRFKGLTLFVFCLYLFWGFFGVDLTMNGEALRFPLHRAYILLTLLILCFNIKEFFVCSMKNSLLMILIFYMFISAAWSSSPVDTFRFVVFLFSSLAICILVALAYRDNQLRLIRWVFWLCFVLIICSIVAALQFPQYGINTKDFASSRWIGITEHPNKLGGLSLACIWLAVNLYYLSASKLEKIVALSSILIAFYTVIHADSMTSILASILAVCYTSYWHLLSVKSSAIKIVIFSIAFLGSLIITTVYMSTTEIVNQTLALSGRDTSLTGRTLLWANGLDAILDHPIIGSGFDDLEGLTKKYHILMSHLHNGYIEVLVKGGLIAGLLMFSILMSVFIKQMALKRIGNSSFVICHTGFVSILVHNMAESSLFKGFNSLSIIFIFIMVFTGVAYYDALGKNLISKSL
ncbi:O-antigen ligase family protein [Methylomonas sp. LW13]|uniref:O-antigen ligase family protein n=2 Tax=unclassified Methylomonas TaxID=2608980 RepID=UPI00051C9D68|nr:O-antigen ligase family protein [Methylomonas sp. LW13]